MLSIFAEEPRAREVAFTERRDAPATADPSTTSEPTSTSEPATTSEPETRIDESGEFEIVLGRRQVASVLFVATVLLAVTCAVSYLAGKALSPKKASAAQRADPVSESSFAPAIQIPMIEASVVTAQAAPQATPAKTADAKTAAPLAGLSVAATDADAPIFADPKAGATYIQMAAVDRGVATIFAEGLRRRGFEAFVAPGPTETMFRVLIGPMPDPAAYTRAKEELDRIGLATFGRKYVQ